MNLSGNSDTLNVLLTQYRGVEFVLNLMSTRSFQLMRKRRRFLLLCMKRMLIIAKAIAVHIQSRKVWTHKRRSTFWEKEVPEKDDKFFKENFRMSRENFQILCNELQALTKHDTQFRKCIPLQKQIAIALYTIGSSAEYRSISNLFGVGKATVCKILKHFCEEVWKNLRPDHLNTYPVTEQCVKANVAGLEKLGFPQCFGAIGDIGPTCSRINADASSVLSPLTVMIPSPSAESTSNAPSDASASTSESAALTPRLGAAKRLRSDTNKLLSELKTTNDVICSELKQMKENEKEMMKIEKKRNELLGRHVQYSMEILKKIKQKS